MGKSNGTKVSKVEKVACINQPIEIHNDRQIIIDDDDHVNNDEEDIPTEDLSAEYDVSGKIDDTVFDISSRIDSMVYDDLVSRTFILDELEEPVDRTFKSLAGLEIIKTVFNALLIDPTGTSRVMTVWGPNANNMHSFFE